MILTSQIFLYVLEQVFVLEQLRRNESPPTQDPSAGDTKAEAETKGESQIIIVFLFRIENLNQVVYRTFGLLCWDCSGDVVC